ncbi:MAG: hypothetical protein HY905_15080 [Deltaproteobacteria bacterium]|nr:hypothetical protein [Deltaproteobacteria bacterium]
MAALVLGWLVATLVGGLLPSLAFEQLTRALPDGSGDLTFPGGAVLLDALVQGRGTLVTALSTAVGVALTWGLIVEPFLRAGLLCSLGRCGARCASGRGVVVRSARHFLRVWAVHLAAWGVLGLAGTALFLSGGSAWIVLPGLWLGAGVLADLAAVALVASRSVGEGLRLFGATIRKRALAAVLGGALLRAAALLPLLGQAALVAAGPGGSPLRPLFLLLLPAMTLAVRVWWWATATEIVARVRDDKESFPTKIRTVRA